STPYVEGTECKLCTRFTDRLCRDDTDGLTRLYHVSGSEVSSVAFRTTTDLRLTSEQRADFNLLDRSLLDLPSDFLRNLLVSVDDHLLGQRIVYGVYRYTSDNPFGQGLYYVFVIFQRCYFQAAQCTAVFLGDDEVVSHIHEPSGQVSGVSRFQ